MRVDSIEYFEQFAPDYDELSKKYSWYSPEVLFGLHYEFLTANQTLLDLGIGTGQSAEPYYTAGLIIDGIDGSEKMLTLCKQKEIARTLIQQDLNDTPSHQAQYKHIISNGTFYLLESLTHLFKYCQSNLEVNGYFCFTVEDPEGDSVKPNRDSNENSLISQRITDNTSLKIFSHSVEYIEDLA
jgi:predicted TPR repeat methyltransferase